MGSLMKDAEQAMGNEGSNQSGGQSTAEQAMGGGGGGSGGGNAMDKEANQVVDQGLSAEGVPGMADGAVNKEMDSEINKFA